MELSQRINSFVDKQANPSLVPTKVLIRRKDGSSYYAIRHKKLGDMDTVRHFDSLLHNFPTLSSDPKRLEYETERVDNTIRDYSKYKGPIWDGEIKPRLLEIRRNMGNPKKQGNLLREITSAMDKEADKVAKKYDIHYPSEGWRSSHSRYGFMY